MKVLLLIDLQNDFLPGGALAVPHGDEAVAVANQLMPAYDAVVATQDWHPPDHLSFASQHPGRRPGDVIRLDGISQVLWPDHCVQGTPGAQFAPRLDATRIDRVVRKGSDRRVDSYSGFFDNLRRHDTGLDAVLRSLGTRALHIVGLATDYCVKASALDAVTLGYRTTVLRRGVRGVELVPGDCQRALAKMAAAGVLLADG